MKRTLDFIANMQNVYSKGNYHSWPNKKINIKFANKFSMIQTIQIPSNFPKDVAIITEQNWKEYATFEAELIFSYDRTLAADGFTLTTEDTTIAVEASNERGFQYALECLGQLFTWQAEQCMLLQLTTKQTPALAIRGLIEGFYGTPWTHAERLDMITYLSTQKMNTYFYAPKDDPYHRKEWRKSYPEARIAEIMELKQACDAKNIDFYFGISPGNDIDYTSDADIRALFQKLQEAIALGINNFTLLLDDIAYTLSPHIANRFQRSGKAHGYLCNLVDTFLSEHLAEYNYIICPTEYWQNYDSVYRADLAATLHADTTVWWTGFNTIAEKISEADTEIVANAFSKDLVLWDNVPVNDLASDAGRIFIAPYYSRTSHLHRHVGVVVNPLIQAELSKISIAQMAEFMWNPQSFHPLAGWKKAISSYFTKDGKYWELILAHFENHHVRNPIMPTLRVAENTKDKALILAHFKELLHALEAVDITACHQFMVTFQPWFTTLVQDATFIINADWSDVAATDRYISSRNSDAEINGYIFADVCAQMLQD